MLCTSASVCYTLQFEEVSENVTCPSVNADSQADDSHLWFLPRASVLSSGDGSVVFPWSTSPSPLFMVMEVWVERDYSGKGSSHSMGRYSRAV